MYLLRNYADLVHETVEAHTNLQIYDYDGSMQKMLWDTLT